MKVILISEENHGIIGCVASEKDVVPWLTRENWINQFTNIWGFNHNLSTLKETYGFTWFSAICHLNLNELSELFDYTFCFESIEVWSAS